MNVWWNNRRKESVCSRKNFIFLINLTVRVDTYFHPIRMTYPIQPQPFFQAASNWGKPAKHSLPQKLSKRTDIHTVYSLLLAAASRHHEESHLIYGPLEFILLAQGFPVDYELDEFNPPHTGTTLSRLQLQNSAQTSSHFIPGQHFLEKFMLLSPNDRDHIFMDDDNVPVLNQQTRLLLHLWRPYTINNALTITPPISLKHFSAYQLHNYFLPSFLPMRLAA